MKGADARLPAPEQVKKPYRKPELLVHGDLRALTQAKRGRRFDGIGRPRTRVRIRNP